MVLYNITIAAMGGDKLAKVIVRIISDRTAYVVYSAQERHDALVAAGIRIFVLLDLPDIIPVGTKSYLWGFVFAIFIEVMIIGIFSLILMFFIEYLFLNRIDNFFYKQIFILATTFLAIFLCSLKLPFRALT